MGPIAILDKSALQRMSAAETARLQHHFLLCVPPILIMEILGDLKKYKDDPSRSAQQVTDQITKLNTFGRKTSAHWRELTAVAFSDRGLRTNFDQIPVSGGREIVDKRGRRGFFIDQGPEDEVFLRWQDQRFDGSEEILAERWREITAGIDLETFQKQLRDLGQGTPKLRTVEEVVRYVDGLLTTPQHQKANLRWAMSVAGVPGDIASRAEYRWDCIGGMTLLEFSPYGFHFLRASLIFNYSLMNGHIGPRSTNRIDLEYLFYLPFCRVFCTADKTQEKLARALMRPGQKFVSADELKADMARLNAWWEGLTVEERKEEAFQFGDNPPDLAGSFTCDLWREMAGPRRSGTGNLALRMTDEQKAALLESMKPSMEAIEELLRKGK